jgi:hypothetical protein
MIKLGVIGCQSEHATVTATAQGAALILTATIKINCERLCGVIISPIKHVTFFLRRPMQIPAWRPMTGNQARPYILASRHHSIQSNN